jgi:hypothetical protein
VHPDEIRLFDHMIDRFALVQLPVLPLPGRGTWLSRAIANHYCDEFAERHCPLAQLSWPIAVRLFRTIFGQCLKLIADIAASRLSPVENHVVFV